MKLSTLRENIRNNRQWNMANYITNYYYYVRKKTDNICKIPATPEAWFVAELLYWYKYAQNDLYFRQGEPTSVSTSIEKGLKSTLELMGTPPQDQTKELHAKSAILAHRGLGSKTAYIVTCEPCIERISIPHAYINTQKRHKYFIWLLDMWEICGERAPWLMFEGKAPIEKPKGAGIARKYQQAHREVAGKLIPT